MADEYIPPTLVTIACPMELSRKRGLFAKKEEDHPASIRITHHDKAMVDAEAKLLGVNFSTFARWCAVQVARELIYHRTGTKPKADL